ncbi:pyridoxamine 5'-phosphate oxidase family protein [Amycolatopsis sp. NPDC006125]|uniref:pyridoxamine 5'-phosphate oxidase family protein n=1 Tax=Amycolatopsis sp. NPDC006125 TaxID=3156730 RepID=UPI0033A9F53F
MPTQKFSALTVAECLRLLRSAPIGRVVYTRHALPAVRPAVFTVPDGHVLVRCTRDSWADRLDGVIVGFETDSIDPENRTGWTILVLGRARVLGRSQLAELPGFTDVPWPPEPGEAFLAIDIEDITGHRLGPTRLPAAGCADELVAT